MKLRDLFLLPWDLHFVHTCISYPLCSLDTQKARHSLWSCGLPGEALLRVVAGRGALPEGPAGGASTMANCGTWEILVKS